MTLDEKLKNERIKRFLLPGDIQNILKYGLTKDQLLEIGMKSCYFSQIRPASIRKRTLRNMIENKVTPPSPEIKSSDIVTLTISGDLYHQRIGVINGIIATDDGPMDIVGIITPNDYDIFTKDAIKLLDNTNQRYITEVEQSTYAALRRKLTKVKKESPNEIHRWIYALVTSESLIKNTLAVGFTEFKLAKEPIIQFTQKEYSLLIEELATESEVIEEQRENLAQQINELEQKSNTQTRKIPGLEYERDRLKTEYEQLQAKYQSLEADKKTIEARLKELELRPTENIEELSERIKDFETEKDKYQKEARENMALAESYDAENKRLKARVAGLNRLLSRLQGKSEEEAAKQSTLEERFIDAKLDYKLIDAIVVGGSQNLTRVSNVTLTRTNWRKNTLGKLEDKSKISCFDETTDLLIRKGVLITNPSQRGTLSVNIKVSEIEDPLLKEYLSDALSRYK